MRTLVEPVRHIQEGKSQVYLRPGPNRRLERAIALYGQPIYPTGSGSAGRTREQQAYYYDQFKNHGGPVAANPNFGRRPHMRFGAIDIDDPGARGAMLAAGWVATTASEWWHFEDPDMVRAAPFFRGWPIVTSFYTASKETTVSMIKKTERGVEWSLFAPLMSGPLGGTPDQLGYRVTGNESTARIWCDMFGIAFESVPVYSRDEYQRAQAEARAIAADVLARIPTSSASLKPVLDAIATVPGKTVDELKVRL